MKRLLLVFAFMLSTSFVLLAQNSERKVTDIVLKSVIGYDGQPIMSGYVYGLDISKGLPLKITDDGGYRSEVGMDFTLPGYESFYYDWTYGESPEITIDLREVARAEHGRLCRMTVLCCRVRSWCRPHRIIRK